MKIILLFLAAASAFGQNQNIIKKIIANGSATANYSVQNVGQVQHLVFAVVSQSPGACNSTDTLYLQGSSDNSNWSTIGPVLALAYGSTDTGTIQGTGLYPYLRVRLVSGGDTDCIVNAWYTGTVIPFSSPQTVINTSNYFTSTINIPASGAGSTTAIATGPGSSATYAIYGIILTQADTTNLYDISIQGGGAACASLTGPRINLTLGGTTLTPNVVLPTSDVPYLITTGRTTLCATGTSAAGSTVTYMTIIYRVEG